MYTASPPRNSIVDTEGGVLILVKKGKKVARCETYSHHKLWTAVTIRMQGRTLGFCTAYLPPGEHSINATTIFEIGKFVTATHIPWLIGGDFNATPEELREMHSPVSNICTPVQPGFLMRAPAILPTNSHYRCTFGAGGSLIYYAFGTESMTHI